MLQASNTGTNFDYSWINTLTGEELSTATTLMVTEPQTIQLTINDNDNGCTADTLITIMENLSPPLAQITEVVPFNCASSEALLAAAEPDNINNSYQWNAPLATTLPATPDSTSTLVFEPGTYILLVENLSNGCQQADTLIVSNDAQAPNGITANVFNPGCSASTGSIVVQGVTGGTSPYSYALESSPFSLSTVFDSLVVGSYLLQVEDALGCTYDSIFTIEQNLLFEVFIDAPSGPYGIGDDITLTVQANQALTDTDSLVWYRDGVLICTNCLSVSDTLLTSLTYTLEAYSNDGCTATDVLFLPVSEVLNIYIPNAFSPNDDGTNDAFQIFPGAGVKSIQNLKIWNRWGGLVHEEVDLNSLPATDWEGRKGNELLPTGVYIYQFEVNLINGDSENYQGEVLLLY
jgi:gliding motility-associated-like protein